MGSGRIGGPSSAKVDPGSGDFAQSDKPAPEEEFEKLIQDFSKRLDRTNSLLLTQQHPN
jgi:hypothetical protein